jgi:hypothetical protein
MMMHTLQFLENNIQAMFEAWGLVLSHLNTLEGHQELQYG